MKKTFIYETCESAYEALENSIANDFNIEWDTYQQINCWLPEFIRETPQDTYWIEKAIDLLRSDNTGVINWLELNSNDEDYWSETSLRIIRTFSENLNNQNN